MSPFVQFIADDMFIIDMLILCYLSIIRFRKRKFFYIYMVIGVAAALPACYYFPNLTTLIFGETSDLAILKDCINYIIQFAVIIGITYLICDISILKSIYVATYCYFIQHLSFSFDRVIRGTLSPSDWVVLSHFLILLGIYALLWLGYYRKITSDGLDKINVWEVVLFSGVIIFVCIILNTYAQNNSEDTKSYRIADCVTCLCGILNQFAYYHICVAEKNREEIEKMWNEKAKQYSISKENISIINVKCHDLKHQIEKFYTDGKIDKESLEEMKNEIDTYDSRIETTLNQAIDTVLTEKNLLCKKKGIKFTALAEGKDIGFIHANDLYVFFANAIDNAIEAVEALEIPEKKVITLSAKTIGEMYYISIQNFTKNMTTFDQNGMPITTKANKRIHGFGTQSMEMFAHKYNGEIHFLQTDDVFNLNVVIPLQKA